MGVSGFFFISIKAKLQSTFSSFTTFWQYASSGPNPGDQDLFNGDSAGLGRCVSTDTYDLDDLTELLPSMALGQ